MRFSIPTIVLIIFIGCTEPADRFDIKGNWYTTDLGPPPYLEFYFSDSTFVSQNEEGIDEQRRYKIVGDTIFFATTDTIHFPKTRDGLVPFHRIIKVTADTMWVKLITWQDTTPWTRFPKKELGYYDLKWTAETQDSLNGKILMDFNQRMWRFYALTYGVPAKDKYDSLLQADFWTWTMKNIKEKKDFILK
jgi:hypothetical protein